MKASTIQLTRLALAVVALAPAGTERPQYATLAMQTQGEDKMNANTTSTRRNIVTRALGALALLCLCSLSATPQADASTVYIQTATSANTISNWTDLSLKDSNPNSIYFVTPNWNPPGYWGTYENHPIGVWFDAARSDWAIFNQDYAPMALGESFNVFTRPAASNVYTHVATASNSSGDSTYLDNVYTNNNPYALIWVTPNYNPGGKGGVYNNHNIGVWYDSSRCKWAIFNQDGSAIPNGAAFNIVNESAAYAPHYFVQTANSSNISGDSMFLNVSTINGANGHSVLVTPVFNPNGLSWGVYENHAIGVWYDSANGRYAIFNQDGSPMTPGVSFNIWIL